MPMSISRVPRVDATVRRKLLHAEGLLLLFLHDHMDITGIPLNLPS